MKFYYPVNDFNYCGSSSKDVTCVTDKSSFRPDAEQVRALKFNPQAGNMTNLQYDYEKGLPDPKNDPVPDVVIALRSGKLDKADVDNIQRSFERASDENKQAVESQQITNAVKKTLGIEANSTK